MRPGCRIRSGFAACGSRCVDGVWRRARTDDEMGTAAPMTIIARQGPARLSMLVLVILAFGTRSEANDLPLLRSPTATDRILIVAPHPDDESLCCAGLIHQTIARGGEVSIVWMTSGDAFEIDAMVVEHRLRPGARTMERLADIRMREARAAAAHLGVPSANLHFLAFPDRGLSSLMGDHYDKPYISPYTHASRNPYAQTDAPGAAYTGATLLRELQKAIESFQPTLVLAPIQADAHTDHSATSRFVQRALTSLRLAERGLYCVVHGGNNWPTPRGLRLDQPLTAPPVAATLPWRRLKLTTADQNAKLEAIRMHHSQMEVMGGMMLSYVRTEEWYSIQPEVRD